ncbi:hypothetical protein M8009_18585 [Halomonas sp. ATCH28]|uniref:Uncharacterized protein n=1 Tax=Halomonas gemina TaxID=2945105 RepID=A0ABT0T5T6_9GAMM|nr:hypothetical protein [Halomonas gemina]MCL7942286.1 hypothetical protein [Halomonas gemina]
METTCKFEGLEYSEGSEVCQLERVMRCENGLWKDTGRDCYTGREKIEEMLYGMPVIMGGDDHIIAFKKDMGIEKSINLEGVMPTRQLTVYAEFLSIRRVVPWIFFSGAESEGGVCAGNLRQYQIVQDNLISIGDRVYCNGYNSSSYKIIVYRA